MSHLSDPYLKANSMPCIPEEIQAPASSQEKSCPGAAIKISASESFVRSGTSSPAPRRSPRATPEIEMLIPSLPKLYICARKEIDCTLSCRFHQTPNLALESPPKVAETIIILILYEQFEPPSDLQHRACKIQSACSSSKVPGAVNDDDKYKYTTPVSSGDEALQSKSLEAHLLPDRPQKPMTFLLHQVCSTQNL